MTDADGPADRGDLHATAVQRARRGRLLIFAVMVVCALAVPFGVVLAGDGARPAGRTAVLLIPVAVLVVLVAVLYPFTRRQDRDPPLSLGADKGTRRAVRRALRTGRAADARIDALARDTATRALHNTWPLKLVAAGMLLQVVAAGLRFGGDADPLRTGLSVLIVLGFGASVVALVVNRRRCRAYLGNAATPEDPP